MQKYDLTIVKNKPCSATTRSETICRTDAAWNKQSKQAGLAWIFTGEGINSKLEGSSTQAFVNSPDSRSSRDATRPHQGSDPKDLFSHQNVLR
ncbi:unnamed protein product [Brassica oleracea var. botrytis]|uniref:Uncharacterized protein n=1 Tax=Brassica carinata TaxID=52824 RepID=A0A8X7RB62_BRACI|nr:hypothetical protein Bca52824_053184 [Brassica carinata]